jgi:hypothetical protein
MKLTTIALAIAFALPATFAFAEGTLNYSTFAARPHRQRRHTHTSRRNHASGQFREYSRADHAQAGSTLTP